jgi:hypothetical protein
VKKTQMVRRAFWIEETIFIFAGLLLPLTKVSSGAKTLHLTDPLRGTLRTFQPKAALTEKESGNPHAVRQGFYHFSVASESKESGLMIRATNKTHHEGTKTRKGEGFNFLSDFVSLWL